MAPVHLYHKKNARYVLTTIFVETQDPLVPSFPSFDRDRVIKKSLTVLSILLLKTKQKQTHTASVKNASSINRHL